MCVCVRVLQRLHQIRRYTVLSAKPHTQTTHTHIHNKFVDRLLGTGTF